MSDDLKLMINWGVPFISAWLVNGWLNRRHELFKKRLEHRLVMFESVLVVKQIIESCTTGAPFKEFPELSSKIRLSREKFELYGKRIEIEIMNVFIQKIEAQDAEGAQNALDKLLNQTRVGIRKELGFSDK